MILNSYQIRQRLEAGMLEPFDPLAINTASYDVHLGQYILVEELPERTRETGLPVIVSLRDREPLHMRKVDLMSVPGNSFLLRPGQFILAQTIEVFNMPLDISAEYKLKSSMARIGLEHLNAGFIDAGFNNSVLTLEFRNLTTFHEIELVYGDRIGQLIFFKHDEVEYDDSYAVQGRYNGINSVSAPLPDKQPEDRPKQRDLLAYAYSKAKESPETQKRVATFRDEDMQDVRKI